MKLIKLTDDHYIVVDDLDLKKDDWCYRDTEVVFQATKELLDYYNSINSKHKVYKITHSTQPLEDVGLNTSMGWQLGFDKIEPLYLSEVKELLGEDTDVWSRKLEYLKKVDENIKHKSQDERIWIFGASDLGFTAGYNQALEDNKDKVSLKDLKRFLAEGRYTISKDAGGNITADFTELISLLTSPKTEWDVEFVDGKLKLA